MKKITLTLIATAMFIAPLAAQAAPEAQTQEPQPQAAVAPAAQAAPAVKTSRNYFRPKGSYMNFSYVTQEMRMQKDDNLLSKAKWGAAFTSGRTMYFHRKPIGGHLWIALDATWFDVNYARHNDTPMGKKLHQLDLSMGIGPALVVNPAGKFGIHTYVKFQPTLAGFFNSEGLEKGENMTEEDVKNTNLMGGYSSMFVAGGAISWSTISFGIEARWGKGTYKDMIGDHLKNLVEAQGEDVAEQYGINIGDFLDLGGKKPALNLKITGFRAYLSFRF
jgi:Ni/Co efflux regulator RcnB